MHYKLKDWPRAWRSHAVFAGQFPVIGGRISSLFYCARIPEPTLDGAPFDPPGASAAYDGVAVVASPSAEDLGGELSAQDRARIDADELRVFDANTPNFSFRCRESLAYGAETGGPAAVIRFLARRPGAEADDFQARWRGRHAELAIRTSDGSGCVVRYVHDEFIAPPPPGYPFDGVAETWFSSAEAAARSFVDPAFARVAQDLEQFCDAQRSVTLLTQVVHRWPRG
jgi:uncharacterized protein (TIGR02118 family)